ECLITGERRMQDLHRNRAARWREAKEHLAHATAPEPGMQPVGTQVTRVSSHQSLHRRSSPLISSAPRQRRHFAPHYGRGRSSGWHLIPMPGINSARRNPRPAAPEARRARLLRPGAATVAEFPSLSWLAPTPAEALAGLADVVRDVLTDLAATGDPIPEPLSARTYSGRFMVRVPSEVHRPQVAALCGRVPRRGSRVM